MKRRGPPSSRGQERRGSHGRGSQPNSGRRRPATSGSGSGSGVGPSHGRATSAEKERRDSSRPLATKGGKAGGFNPKGRWVIGMHACMEAIRVRPHAIADVFVRVDWSSSESHRELVDRLADVGIGIQTCSMEQLAHLGSGHQGVALRLTEEPNLDWAALAKPGQQLILILDGIEDPHNLGSILRTAWLTGVKGVLIPEDRAVGLTPTVCKIASGGAEHVAVESHTSFGSVFQQLKDIGFWIYGLAESGKSRPYDLKLPEKVAWVIGSEGRGLRISTERLCDELVRLPQVSSGSSYNASIAAAMALAETCRQFGKPE
ncbi:MAG: RNA methyltransferase [Bdellovibrionaceae bacterium]|nr:RNA methyltransferase [Pseudobdellovibrionaceae bacterium]